MENREMGEMGGRKERDDDKKKKGKGKEKEIAEEEMPRNKKFMEDEKKKGKQIKVSDDGDDHQSWDWRDYAGIISNVLQQGDYLICWAIAFIRAIEALFNIGKRLEQQRSFSIQHLINNVQIGKFGLEDTETLGDFIAQNGILEEGECSYKRVKETCDHVEPITEMIDNIASIDTVDDVELARLVMRHPVVGVLPLWGNLVRHRHGIYHPESLAHRNLQYHAVLIIDFGVDNHGNYYWIVQNSWGRQWGQEGFGWLHREHRRGRSSLFTRVFYGEKNGYPQKKNK